MPIVCVGSAQTIHYTLTTPSHAHGRTAEFVPLEARYRVSVALSNVTCASWRSIVSGKISRGRKRRVRETEKNGPFGGYFYFFFFLISSRYRENWWIGELAKPFLDVSRKISLIGRSLCVIKSVWTSSVSSSKHADTRFRYNLYHTDANPEFSGIRGITRYSADVKCEMDTPHQPALWETFLLAMVTSLTGTTPKTRRIYTRRADATRGLICSRVIPVEATRAFTASDHERPRQVNACVTVVKGRRDALGAFAGHKYFSPDVTGFPTKLWSRSVCAVGRPWLHNNEGDSGNCFYVSGIAQRATIASRCCIPATSWREEGDWEREEGSQGDGGGGWRWSVGAAGGFGEHGPGIMRHWVIWRTIQSKRLACRACGHNGASVSAR